MNIYDIMKILASENKAKIIAKLICWNCPHDDTVSDMCGSISLKQGNMSKHLMELRQKKVVENKKVGRKVIYTINKDFQKQWGPMIKVIIKESKELKKLHCGCE